MLFSDALLLGSTLLKPIPYYRRKGSDMGCAVGMAETAIGLDSRIFGAEDKWSWLNTKLSVKLLPCGCNIAKIYLEEYIGAIIHIFNEHVCEDKTWTLEQLVDWIRSVEPKEECQVPIGADDVCGLPPDSAIHTTSTMKHEFVGNGYKK